MGLSDLAHHDDGVYDSFFNERVDLGFVRHQLDCLAHARSVSVLRPVDHARYRELCEMEGSLLALDRDPVRAFGAEVAGAARAPGDGHNPVDPQGDRSS